MKLISLWSRLSLPPAILGTDAACNRDDVQSRHERFAVDGGPERAERCGGVGATAQSLTTVT